MAGITTPLLAALSILQLASASWTFLDQPEIANCATDQFLEFTGNGEKGCGNFADGDQPVSFMFESNAGEELVLFFQLNCGASNSRQVFPGEGKCFTLLSGGAKAQSFSVITSNDALTANLTDGEAVKNYG